ncbi:Serine carboxypeptidase-like 25 isoform 1 [Hibiscus syriacus]|uniref:Exocyst subunit Exo70 family protein n=1 Tax=Hibiscus syriacus TaxID=106335 RepID=A0A6A3B276_HIBSY|nr:exocyst complex component EXO70E2-like [Hibiscus syriacus]KAE8709988.1 Serine carboxypeptidase-like 25 isoform 1 [Hibiscus syriacus]
MGDYEPLLPQLEGDDNLIAAVKHIVGALSSNKNLTKDVKKILAGLGTQLSTMAAKPGIEHHFSVVEEKIMSYKDDKSMIWDSGSEEAVDYLNAVDEAVKLKERLENQCSDSKEEKDLLRRACDVLQMAMQRLEEEFKHMLVHHRQPFEPQNTLFRSSEDDGSLVSLRDDSVRIDSVHPDVIPDLKCIASLMFKSNYGLECCRAYVLVVKKALAECLFNLEMEKLSIEDVLNMEWGALYSKIKRWIRTMKVFIRPYLASEKWLCDQVLADLGSGNLGMFVEAAKDSMLQLLNFAHAVSMGSRQPEKLVRILDMYEVLADLLPDIDALFVDEAGSSIRTESHEVFKRLGDFIMAAFHEFETAIATNMSTSSLAGGGIHHLTRYVMNYILLLADYKNTLKDFSGSCCTMSLHLRSLASALEAKLDEKSKLYKDPSLQHFFLMNNIHYMAQKVKNSELRLIFGDDWIRKRNWKFQRHAMDYERATWSSVLSLLKGESDSSSGSISGTLLKERLRRFYAAFEEVYKTQTAWLILDVQLREDLRISTSLAVIQAYRTFIGRQIYRIAEKHIKYNSEDMEDYLLDLFEGSQKSLHNPHRR